MEFPVDIPADRKLSAQSVSAYVLPSLSQVLFISIFLVLSLKGAGLLNDGDTGWHIRTGEYILKTFSIPRADIFSFITPSPSWIAHEWLSDVIMASVHRFFGLTGIVIFFSFLFASIFYFTFHMMGERKGNIILTVLIVLIAAKASFIHCLARPHLFSLALILAFYYILNSFHYKNVNRLYLLPPLMLLWVNLHGGFIIGLVLICIYSFSNLVSGYASSGNETSSHARKLKALALTGFICLAATLINPYGYRILLFPFTLISTSVIMNNTVEFLSPNFHDGNMTAYRLLLYATVAVFFVSRRKPDIVEFLLALLFIHMSLTSVRYIPLFAIIISPILLEHTASLLNSIDRPLVNSIKTKGLAIAAVDGRAGGSLLVLCSILTVIILGASGIIKHDFNEKDKPVAAVEFLKREPVHGNMFNEMQFGDYTIYAGQGYKVFFDGRTDMYGPARFKDYLSVATISPGWEEILRKYDINWVFFNTDSALSTLLAEKKEWHLIYSDTVANIFVRDTAANRELINKYNQVKRIIVANCPRTF